MGARYIVASPRGPMVLGHFTHEHDDQPRGGVLFHGDNVTLFGSHKSATRAIERTVAYADKERLSLWPKHHELRIYRVAGNPNVKGEADRA